MKTEVGLVFMWSGSPDPLSVLALRSGGKADFRKEAVTARRFAPSGSGDPLHINASDATFFSGSPCSPGGTIKMKTIFKKSIFSQDLRDGIDMVPIASVGHCRGRYSVRPENAVGQHLFGHLLRDVLVVFAG